ncbi:hypothetical protein BTVI_52675 [Pitangus sulphuratus]|nr:hypothetical protein BTVI_52675 [Pitangus sulphuratus]
MTFRLVVKTALKLLLVFVEYTESNAPLLIQAVSTVDEKREAPPGKAVFPLPSEKQQSHLEEKMISNQCNPFEEKDESVFPQLYELTGILNLCKVPSIDMLVNLIKGKRERRTLNKLPYSVYSLLYL